MSRTAKRITGPHIWISRLKSFVIGLGCLMALSITVNAASLAITTVSLADATVGMAYSQTLTASGGTGSYNWSVPPGGLPAGLTLSGAVISGTPTTPATATPATASFTVQVKDGGNPQQTASKNLSITVNAA